MLALKTLQKMSDSFQPFKPVIMSPLPRVQTQLFGYGVKLPFVTELLSVSEV